MKNKLLLLIILFGMIVIVGCVSSKVNTPQNNTTSNVSCVFPNVTANISIDASNYNDSNGLTATEKLEAIRIAIGAEYFQQYSRGSTNISIREVLPSNASKTSFHFDSGFLNTSDRIVSVPIDTFGPIPAYWPVLFAIYVDITNEKVVGGDDYNTRVEYSNTEIDLPENSFWYHQLAGATRTKPEYNTTRISLSVVTGDNNTDRIYPLILDTENFKKFRNGSRYEALQYVDYRANQTRLIDGKTSLRPQNYYNGTAAWFTNISISDRSPVEGRSFEPTGYYIVLQNNAGQKTPVILNIYTAYFFS